MFKKLIYVTLLALALICVFGSCKVEQAPSETNNPPLKAPTVEISEDGYWVIDGEKTDVKAKGEDGKPAEELPEPPLGLSFFPKDDGSYAVEIGNAKELSKIEIPSTYNGKPVTHIANFGGTYEEPHSTLEEVIIPNTVTIIDNYAFYNCDSLTNIVIPDSVTTIGNNAFSNCNSLTSIVIPDSVTTIGNEAFGWCTNLTSVTVGNNVTNIGSDAFYYCEKLTSITLGNSVTTIGKWAFGKCEILTSIIIPDSVTTIGEHAFYCCTSLTDITLGNSVNTIGNSAFYGCDNLTSVHITDIAAWCNISFEGYGSNPLSTVGGNMYVNGKLLTELVIPDTVTAIGYYAFYGCLSLTSVTIPSSVTSIGEEAFYLCENLTSVYITDIAAWFNISFEGYGSNPLSAAAGGDMYVNGELLTELVIPDTVTAIGSYAFEYCLSLTSVTIPSSVTTIDTYAFAGCSNLTTVTLGNGVTTIGERAFYECYSLTNITIPDSVTTIEAWAFNGCSNLTSVIFETPAEWELYVVWDDVTITVSASELSDPSKAAEYLRDSWYEWTKK